MTEKSEEPQTIEEGFIKSQDIGFKQIIMRHLDRISQLSASIKEKGNFHAFHLAVITLEQFLYPYLDKEYFNKKEQFLKRHKDGELEKLLCWSWDVNSAENKILPISLSLLELLQQFMARRNLLLEEETGLKTRV